MESKPVCGPCIVLGKSSVAIKLCYDCDERLCKDCLDHHSKFKALLSHHLIDISFLPKLQSFTTHCELHADNLLDSYCSQHSAVCCRSCIPLKHQTCKDVISIESTSMHIADSAILANTLKAMDNALETLTELTKNRENNLTKFEDLESDILTQVHNAKEQIKKQIDKHERTVIKELSTMKQRNESKLNEQKSDLAKLTAKVLKGKEQIEVLKEHGSKQQLFLALQKQMNKIQAIESRLQKLTSTFEDTKLTFYSWRYPSIKSIFSIVESSTPCTIKHSSFMLQQLILMDLIESQKSNGAHNDGSKLTMPTSSIALDTIQDELHELIVVKAESNEQIINWIKANLDHSTTKDKIFIRALMTVVCSSKIKGRGKTATVDPTKVRDAILQKYFGHQLEFELQALYALQALVHKLDHPPGVLRTLFDHLYDEDIISEDAFTKWEVNEDPTEQEGRERAMKSVVKFFTWLREANVGSDG